VDQVLLKERMNKIVAHQNLFEGIFEFLREDLELTRGTRVL